VAFQPAVMDFAVGKNSAQEATAAVLDHPAIEPGDQITSADQLTPTEILSYRLRPDEGGDLWQTLIKISCTVY